MRRWDWRDARGMSLVEMMVVIAVLALVTGGVFSVFTASLQAYWKGDLSTQVQQGARVGLDRLTRDLRQARRLYTGGPWGSPAFTFYVQCNPQNPELSFALPHTGSVTLSFPNQWTPPQSTITMTDADPVSGQIPYDGSFVSYYLSSAQQTPGTPPSWPAPNTSGPYLIRLAYDKTAATLSWTTIASNVTGLDLSAGGSCPTAASRQLTVTVTASQTTVNQSATDVVKMDVYLRNQ